MSTNKKKAITEKSDLIRKLNKASRNNQIEMDKFNDIDRVISYFMKQWGFFAVRLSFAIIFIWFGILKPFGLSAAEPLVIKTVAWLPFLTPQTWLSIIGWWEVAIGITFLFKATTRIAIGLLFLQMAGTFMPLFLLTEITFQNNNFLLPSIEGQYIIKNLMIISGAMVIGGRVYK
ncbi:MAG: hypothetical protein AAF600_04365 [Bacteroidota bacterium]